eukprot:6719600-Pyramimonas_sp.AAC.1
MRFLVPRWPWGTTEVLGHRWALQSTERALRFVIARCFIVCVYGRFMLRWRAGDAGECVQG